MIRAILRRLRLMVVTLAAISVISFLIIQAPPGDFLTTYITQLRMRGEAPDDAMIASLEARYGLDRPLHVQYLKWIWGVVQGDLGRSMAHNVEVNKLLAQRLPGSLAISTVSLIIVYLLGLPIGIYSATRQYSAGDYLFTVLGFMGLAIPNFLFALILLWLTFSLTGNAAIGLFSSEYTNAPWSFAKLIDLLKHLWMPSLIVGTAGTAALIRVVRASLLDELRKLYVTVARAKGVAERRLLYRYPGTHRVQPYRQHDRLDPAGAGVRRAAGIARHGHPHTGAAVRRVLAEPGYVPGGQRRDGTQQPDSGRHAHLRHPACRDRSAYSGGGLNGPARPPDRRPTNRTRARCIAMAPDPHAVPPPQNGSLLACAPGNLLLRRALCRVRGTIRSAPQAFGVSVLPATADPSDRHRRRPDHATVRIRAVVRAQPGYLSQHLPGGPTSPVPTVPVRPRRSV